MTDQPALVELEHIPDSFSANLMLLSIADLESVLPEWRDASELSFAHFIESNGNVLFNLWRLHPCCDFEKAAMCVETGETCADELLAFARVHNSPAMISFVAAELLRRPGMHGCMIREGFFARLVAAAFRGALN
jgi:hypothetical protein